VVLVIVRRKAGPHERRIKTLKGELENNSRNPTGLVGKKAQLTLSRGKKKEMKLKMMMMWLEQVCHETE
jgi:hypothetical protein